ncbi:MAG: peptide chain release factor N(5)-glutamine methyltransferase [Balneolaceae bacterium]|nr:peptide chain release factor N(5)-glutamine methyltransferase [Balneolaceae bacterium]
MSTELKEWTVLSMLEWGTDFFKEKGIPNPRLSIEWLLAKVLQIKRLDLYLKFDRPLSRDELDEIRPLVKRRAAHEPLQYIIGFSDFVNARIEVNPNVLIPRIETEQLVEIILEEQQELEEASVLDIGTGSGCIPIALKMERPDWDLHALDISDSALELAAKNATANSCTISFLEGNILDPKSLHFDQPFDLIVSNPPYVLPEEKETLEKQVIEHEPGLALFCDDLEKMYRGIIDFSENNLKKSGHLYLEIHENYSDQIISFFDDKNWSAEVLKDYENKPRFIVSEKLF